MILKTDFEVTRTLALMFLVVVFYLYVMWKFGDKHNAYYEKLNCDISLHYHKKITQEKLSDTIKLVKENTQKIKLKAIMLVSIIGLLHAVGIYLLGYNVLYPIIAFIIALLLIIGVFSLKGARVIYDGSEKYGKKYVKRL